MKANLFTDNICGNTETGKWYSGIALCSCLWSSIYLCISHLLPRQSLHFPITDVSWQFWSQQGYKFCHSADLHCYLVVLLNVILLVSVLIGEYTKIQIKGKCLLYALEFFIASSSEKLFFSSFHLERSS